MKDVAGLSNLLTDFVVNVSYDELEKFKAEKERCKAADPANKDYHKFLVELIKGRQVLQCRAGGAANTIFNLAKLGLGTCLMGSVGDDSTGMDYIDYVSARRIESRISVEDGKSGVSYIMITPDGERNISCDIGVAGNFGFSLRDLKDYKLFHTTGYEISTDSDITEESIRYAKKIGARVSFDLASASMIRGNRSAIERVVEMSDILFMTEEEAGELMGDPIRALSELSKEERIVALKKGKNGSVIGMNGEQYEIPVYPTKLVNTCGAGDAYASGVLFGYFVDLNLEEVGNFGSYIASRICSREESHL